MMQEKIKKIADHFGLDSQLNKTQEECAELIQAISKVKIEGFTDTRLDELLGEIADVENMLPQIKHLLEKHVDGATGQRVDIKKQMKINRTIETYGVKI